MEDALGVLRILEACRILGLEKKTKVYQASTSELYGKVEEVPQRETTPFHPYSPYAVAKQYGFWITKEYREAYGMFAVNGILFNHESERRGENFVTRKITLAAGRIAEGLQDHLELGNMDSLRDWGYAKDYVECMWMILQHDTPEDFVIATGEQHTVRDFTEKAFAANGITIRWEGEGIDEKGYDGTGLKPVIRTLKESGYTNITVVKEQEQPDGTFPTCPYPNPEVRQAMELGIEYAKKNNADLLLATDPDCDRVGIAVKNTQGEYVLLSGNETGMLLLDYICSRRTQMKTMPEDPVTVKTIVTIDMAERIAAKYGVKTINVLTGFKFIGEQIGFLEKQGKEDSYIFGMEESYGYLSGSYVRDAISALGISSFAAGAVSFFVQHATLQSIIQTAYSGYTTTIEEGVLQSILNRGGMGSMLQYVAIISFAVGMGGMLEKLGVLEHILNAVVKRINSDGSMILVTLIVGYITSLISCSQPMSHVLTGRLMAPVFKERKVAPEILSRCLEDSGTMAGPMIPWHGYGVYMAGTLGVAWAAFFPYLFLLYLTPIFSIIYGFTGISIKHVSGEEVAE